MEILTPEFLAIVPVTTGLVEVVKVTGLPDRFAPLASLLIGVGLAFFVADTVPAVILGGIAAGLMASGLYSGTRAMVTG